MLRLTALRLVHPPSVASTFSCTHRQITRAMALRSRKPGVATDDELATFVSTQKNIVVVDARNPDFAVEPGDEKTSALAPLGGATRPRCVNLPYDRVAKALDLAPLEPLLTEGKATPIITHCGGGGRGQVRPLPYHMAPH